MEIKNPRYQNQGIHVICSIFTVEKGITKVLLIRRKKEPFQNYWGLVGGALYNNENIEDGLKREIFEKTGIENFHFSLCNVYREPDTNMGMHMVAISYVGIVDSNRVNVLKETLKTTDSDWIPIDKVSTLAYNHNEILQDGLEMLKEKIINSNILKSLFPDGFTLPELQKVYEAVLQKKLDRRNFRRKLLSLDLIIDTEKKIKFEGKKPANIYEFKDIIESKNVF